MGSTLRNLMSVKIPAVEIGSPAELLMRARAREQMLGLRSGSTQPLKTLAEIQREVIRAARPTGSDEQDATA
jgi:hypothetical protein